MELIPYLGPFLGALPPILVALFTDPISAVWVALLFLGIQQLEGHIVAPQIFGHTLRINPLLVIFALLLGRAAVRDRGRADGAPDPVGAARDDGLPEPSSDARAVGALAGWAVVRLAAEPPAEAEPPVLSVQGVDKRFGERQALRAVSFDVRPGELVAVVGPNGAGKTTLLSILAGVQQPSAGRVLSPTAPRAGRRRDRVVAAEPGALLEAVGRREPAAVRAP